MIEEALVEARRLAHENRLEGKTLDELDALEDDEDADFLDHYRNQRLSELSTISQTSVYNQVYPLQKPDYAREVTEASQKSFVLVLLTSSVGTNTESTLIIELWREMAARFGDVKFCQMRADLCIEGYPDKNTPTVLVYRDADIKRQLVTLKDLRGVQTTAADLEKMLIDLGAVKLNDARLRRTRYEEPPAQNRGGIRRGKNAAAAEQDGDDSDWD